MGETESAIYELRKQGLSGDHFNLPDHQPIGFKSKFRDHAKKILKTILAKRNFKFFGAITALVLIFIPIFTYIYFASDLKDKASIMNRNNAGVQLLDDTGQVFFSFYHPKDIEFVPLSDISKNVQQAVIVSEDRDFYNNPGFSPRGFFRAFATDVKSGSLSQGGSTITQQLVKNALLNSGRNVLRKYQEIILALEIDRRYSKNDILEMYLNSIYFGEGSFGIQNAAQKYFGKSAKDLNLAEASILAAILPAPSALSPVSGDLDAAKRRQEIVLGKMVEAGDITESQKNQVLSQKLTFAPPQKEEINTIAPHFALMVKDYLIQKYGEENITRSGYKVKTSISRKWQEAAQNAVKNQVTRLARNKVTNGAAVVEDPKTGQVKALVGSMDWDNNDFGKVNMAITPRQPGSSFKPIIYERALEDKLITPATLIDDKPVSFGSYKPKNFDGKFRGPVTVRRALVNSLNIPAVKVMEKVGVADGLDNAKKLGITTLSDQTNYGLALVLGAGEVKLLELTNVYATFANAGVYHEPNYILEIKDKRDKTIFEYKGQAKRVVAEGPAFLISSILSDNATRAEVFGNALTVSRPAAAKTGTTEEYKDALTLGYTPDIAIGVWVGNNDNTPMDNIAGALGAAPIWTTLMNTFFKDLPDDRFIQPGAVVKKTITCTQAQTPTPTPSPQASVTPIVTRMTEFFLKGTEPQDCPSPIAVPDPTETSAPSSAPTPAPSPAPQTSPSPSPSLSPSPLFSPILSPLPT